MRQKIILTEEQRAEIAEHLNKGMSYRYIAEQLEEKGFKISQSALARNYERTTPVSRKALREVGAIDKPRNRSCGQRRECGIYRGWMHYAEVYIQGGVEK